MISRFPRLLLGLGAVALFGAMSLNAAGLIILEGSDAQTFHGYLAYSNAFMNGAQAFSSAPLLPVLAVGSDPIGAPAAGKVFEADLCAETLASLLANYSAIYLGSPGTCCSENSAVAAGHEADISAFVAAGRGLTIEDYQGGAAFDSILGFTADSSKVYGLAPGGGSSCFDGNTWTAGGTAFLGAGVAPTGDPVPAIGCFGHQAYDSAYWASQGFTTNLVHANPGSVLDHDAFVVVTNGGGGLVEATVPEPSSILLLGSVALLIGHGLKRRVRRSK